MCVTRWTFSDVFEENWMIGDPFYGGNQNFVGWDLIRYPGVRTSVWPRLQTQLEAGELSPNHRSAYDSEYFEKAVVRTATKGTYHGD